MEGVPVEEVDYEKDLGVTFTTGLKSVAHCTMRTPKPTAWVYLIGQ